MIFWLVLNTYAWTVLMLGGADLIPPTDGRNVHP